MADVKYEYDQDPRYGWASVDIGSKKSILIVVHSEKHGSLGFQFEDGEMVPTCICSARYAGECACPNVSWEESDYDL